MAVVKAGVCVSLGRLGCLALLKGAQPGLAFFSYLNPPHQPAPLGFFIIFIPSVRSPQCLHRTVSLLNWREGLLKSLCTLEWWGKGQRLTLFPGCCLGEEASLRGLLEEPKTC